MNKKVLALYIRLSQEDKNEGESNSIRNQRGLLRAYIESYSDLSQYEVVEFCDDGYSGTNFDRPGVRALLKEVRMGNVDCILVKDFSRFGRNYIDIGDYLEQIFPFLGIRFISVNDHFDSNNFDGTTGGLDVGFKNLVYSLYSTDVSKKVRSVKRAQMERGEFMGSRAPFGYARSPENRKKLVVDEEAAAVVRRIFEMAYQGKNAVQIAVILNEEKVPTPYIYKRLKGCDHKFNVVGNRNYWLNTTILTIIHDERYTGKMINGRSRNPVVGAKHGKRVSKSEWIVVPHTHEAIISQELFDSVQDRFSSPGRTRKEQVKARPLVGKVKCGRCRHSMRRSHSSPSTAYYYCKSHQYVVDSNCTKGRIPESSLMQMVLLMIGNQIESMLDMNLIINKTKIQSHNDITILKELTWQSQAALARLRKSKIKVYEKYKDGILDRETFTRQKADISCRIVEMEGRIDKLKRVLKSSYQDNGQTSIIENFGQYEGGAKLWMEMVDELIDCIYIYESEKIEIIWNYMDEYMGVSQYAKTGI